MSGPKFLLDPQSLGQRVPPATFERGLEVLRNQQVLECTLTGAGSQEWAINGAVQGSKSEIYDLSVTLEVTGDGQIVFFDADCSCPVGHNCKHSVALTLRAAYKSGGMRRDSPGGERPGKPVAAALSPDQLQAQQEAQAQARLDQERRQAQQKVSQWLGLFGDDGADRPADDSSGQEHADTQEHMVFTLSLATMNGQPVLQLGFGTTRRLKNGNWAKLKQPRYSGEHNADGEDLEIVRLIESLADRTYAYPYSTNQGLVAGPTGLLALQLASSTGRLFSCTEDRFLGQPLVWGAPQPLAWRWSEVKPDKTARTALEKKAGKAGVTLQTPEPVWTLAPQLPDEARGARCFANMPPLYLNTSAGLCGLLETPGVSSEHLLLLMKAPPIPQSAFALHETTLLRRLAGLPLPPVMKAPERVEGITPTAHLHISTVAADERDQLGLLRATLRFDYAGLQHYALHEHNPVLLEQAGGAADADPGIRRIQLYRDLAAERGAHQALHGLGLAGDTAGRFYRPFDSAAGQHVWLQWLDDDFAALRAAGLVVTAEPGLASRIARADALEVQMSPPPAAARNAAHGQDDSQSPWFDLSLGMFIDGQRRNILPLLPELLAQLGAARHSQVPASGSPGSSTASEASTLQLSPFVYLAQEGNCWLRLPTEPLRPWLQALLDLVGDRSSTQGSDFNGEALRLSRLEAMRVGAALGAGTQWQGADGLRKMVGQLAGRNALPEVAPPAGLKADLRPYQLQGLVWLQFLRTHGLAGILADDMGLGKTLQTLAHILVEKEAGRLDLPVLIIAPVSLMGNWRKETERFTPDLRALVLHGKDRHALAADIARHDIVIAPYSLLQRDRERWLEQPWHLVVLDEAQNIKNASSHAAQVVGELNTRHRLCLSGTPMENHLGELWSLFHFLMPGFLGSQARFKTLYRTPIEKHGDSERAEQLRRRVAPFMLRRHKSDVATDLPEKQVAISSVELGDQQADLYETIRLTTENAVREALASKGLAKSQIQILDALLKLRQVCCDPRLVPVAAAKKIKQSAKLELLMELLPELLAEGRKVLLFSQFTSMLALIEDELKARGIAWVKLTGQSQKRDALIERFTSGAVPLFLISLKAGGVGLNLTQADTVIHYDPWWNPAVETQATDRAHRIGQTQRVMVYKLVAQGTIEERILALQERKAALAESMYSGSQARKQPLFTESDVAELLKPLG
ncbi:MAG: DEAD/DEAH box helicase [Polaromonas sp.]|uniref:DEAD/DEAH box helicase n=1 Tax=Polaromonas sp. TaxID=1869339 RepID=UPI00273182B6|nr:DEAD/DEAH box helicase [Polaromonas sp.]MDP2449896.1 DEAD/DEAH box helicase [Polaromonas sp.]MDP3246228.1 DEAD/DEAH box helicase [Polaromonas sp.]MDP3757934.1 DEAD/DEAH box helicase [Polaromonas sp.]